MPYHILLNQIQRYTIIWIAMTRTDNTNDPDIVRQAEKVNVIVSQTIRKQQIHTHLLHIECKAQYCFAALKQTTS